MQINRQRNTSPRNFEYRLPRLQTAFHFWLQLEPEGKGIIGGVCTDISPTGLGADLEECLPLGSQVRLVLPSVLKAEPLLIRARVVSQEARRHGFAFRPRRSSTKEITALIRELGSGTNPMLLPEKLTPSRG